MIKQFSVKALNGSLDYNLEFHPDLNIVTGKNGSGKTTLLKLIWYMLSPNVERTVPEILFASAELKTGEFTLVMNRREVKKREKVQIIYTEGRKDPYKVEVWANEFGDSNKVEEVNQRILGLNTASVFFPTFRRIEGGFSLDEDRRYHSPGLAGSLVDSLSRYSRMMTVNQHRFVASISTSDIEDLLTRQYADIADKTNALHLKLSQFIFSAIGAEDEPKTTDHEGSREELAAAKDVLEKIRHRVTEIEEKREELMQPFSVLSKLIQSIFNKKGIRITSNLILGQAQNAIKSSVLSSGEKQMLSFLCYNAFNRSCPIFIDEPELSLHIDWQRLLFPMLVSQNSTNQFVVSTHSPFIYSRYPEKELLLDEDRGNSL